MRSESARKRSPNAQLTAMRRQWRSFSGQRLGDGTLIWKGWLKPQAQPYAISVCWHPAKMPMPYVFVADPPLRPRTGTSFADIPHLIFNVRNPEQSALCLFDPDGQEWSSTDLIADTTILWTSEWLTYYELWHLTGTWLAPNVGYESVAQMMRADAHTVNTMLNDVH